jgi:hypothetical protein
MPGLALIFGFLAASAALLAQVFVSFLFTLPLTDSPSLLFLIGAAAIEESMKFAFLIQLGKRSAEGSSPLQALLFGAGFVAAEMALIFSSTAAFPGFMSLGAIALVHLISTLILYGGFRLRESFSFSPLAGLLGATLLHVLYNASR